MSDITPLLLERERVDSIVIAVIAVMKYRGFRVKENKRQRKTQSDDGITEKGSGLTNKEIKWGRLCRQTKR